MKLLDEYDLDAEIAKYGGRLCPRNPRLDRQIEAVDPASAPFDLDAEIAKYGGQTSPQGTAGDPFTALRQSDPSLCKQAEAFANTLDASVDIVVPRGARDPRMAGGMSWARWARRRLEEAFRTGHVTMAQAEARQEMAKAERAAWLKQWRKVQRGWARWMRWWFKAPADAEEYRDQHEDGRIDWLLDLAAQRTPLGRAKKEG
jgi:hypothetical protein